MPNAIIHEFTLLTSASDVEDLPLDAIHAACDDAAPMSSSGVAYIGFAREATTRENAIAAAVRDLTATLIKSGSPHRVVGVEGPEYDPCEYRSRASAPAGGLMMGRPAHAPEDAGDLRGLRESVGISQADLAGRMGVGQAAVSKLERRSDLYVSSLRQVVEVMGGQLDVQVRSPDWAPIRLGRFDGAGTAGEG